MNEISSDTMQLEAKGKTARLRFVISVNDDKQDWRCNPGDFLGAAKGIVKWKGRAIGLYSDDPTPYGVLEIPSDGLDSVPIGAGSSAWFAGLGEGTWTLISKNTYEGN